MSRTRLAINFTFKDGVYFSPEKIDEATVFPTVSAGTPEPLVLNFRHIKTINSYGTRKLLVFVRSWHPRKIEYWECPSIFVDTINIVRDLIGSPRNPSIVKSFAVPHYCVACANYFDIMVAAAAINRYADNLGLTASPCPKCQSKDTEIDAEPDGHLAFYDP